MPVISLRRESAICEACGKPVRLINLSGWARHRPVVTEADS